MWLGWSFDVGPCNMIRSLGFLLSMMGGILPVLSLNVTCAIYM